MKGDSPQPHLRIFALLVLALIGLVSSGSADGADPPKGNSSSPGKSRGSNSFSSFSYENFSRSRESTADKFGAFARDTLGKLDGTSARSGFDFSTQHPFGAPMSAWGQAPPAGMISLDPYVDAARSSALNRTDGAKASTPASINRPRSPLPGRPPAALNQRRSQVAKKGASGSSKGSFAKALGVKKSGPNANKQVKPPAPGRYEQLLGEAAPYAAGAAIGAASTKVKSPGAGAVLGVLGVLIGHPATKAGGAEFGRAIDKHLDDLEKSGDPRFDPFQIHHLP